MKTLALFCRFAAFFILLLTGCEGQKPAVRPPAPPPGVQAGAYMLSGPYLHENLAIFLFHGADKLKGKTYLTLQEALEQKKVMVHETGNVQELSIENLSDEEVYVQSGDIVKGGRQDRVIALDFIAPPKSGKMPISSFCVEHGRWRARGNEAAFAFSYSNDQVASRELKLAAKLKGDQSAVWQEVANSQGKLSLNVGPEVVRNASPSSMQLALENTKVQGITDAYIKALAPIVDGKPDSVGYAFAINGKFNSADVYVSHEFFKKLWPKLLKASAVEAVAELQKDKPFPVAKPEDVRAAMADAEKGQKSEKDAGLHVRMETQESERNVYFKTRPKAAGSAAVHENWAAKQ